MSKLPIALGLFSVRGTLFTDMKGTLCKVKEMGYDGVEFFGPFSQLPQSIKDALQEVDLRICGWHVSIEALEGGNFASTVAYLKAVGVDTLVVPYLAGDSAQAWEQSAKRMNAAALKLKDHGMYLGYHNHAHEFSTRFGGKTAWEILMDSLSSDIFPQIDTGNGLQGGMNLNAELEKFQGRLRTVHFKPYKAGAPEGGHDVMFGEDDHDLKTAVALCEKGGAIWNVVEFETENTYSQMGGAREALKSFKKVLGI
jgi:sugar phosphate isomerase/epimerase